VVSNLLPANGQTVVAGTTDTDITWTKVKGATSDTQMKIEYTPNAAAGTPTWYTIVAETDNDGSFTWPLVPGDYENGDLNNDVRLRITQADPPNSEKVVYGVYPSPVGIKGVLQVTEPDGDSWVAGNLTPYEITFIKTGEIQGVKIYYSALGNFSDEIQINTGTEDISATAEGDPHVWEWTIPVDATLTTGKTGKIKVKAETPQGQKDRFVAGTSSGFQVRGGIMNVTPAEDLTLADRLGTFRGDREVPRVLPL
jgi:hypothetical protein